MLHRLTFFVALLGLALLAPGPSRAQECSTGCSAQVKACVRNAKADGFACKIDCLANAPAEGRRACVQACGSASRATRSSCVTAIRECIDTCAPTVISPDQQTCLAPCGTALGECARSVVDDTRACLSTCRDAADKVACWRDCVSGAQTSATACAGDLNVCASGCGVTPPPLPTPPVGGTCGAQCGADLTQCLSDVASAALTCGSGCFASPNPFQCLVGCKDPAAAGAAACRTTFDSCTASCAP